MMLGFSSIVLLLSVSGLSVNAAQQPQDADYDYPDGDDKFVPVSPCGVAHAGDPDLTTYDIISSYRFDENNYQYNGVRRIDGSTGYQTAYHIEEYSNTTIESSRAFPKGVPTEFSFECTFRVPEIHTNEWYLFELSNYEFESLMSITVNPVYNALEFSLPKYDGSLQTVKFEEIEIFDRSWHKVMLGVTQESVQLWVDCKPIPQLPLDLRGYMDITEGFFSIARDRQTYQSVPIDLQWMIFSCDVKKPERTTCEDIPPRREYYPNTPKPAYTPITTPKIVEEEPWPPLRLDFLTTSTQQPWLLSTTPSALAGQKLVCPAQCPAGPPGLPGTPGRNGSDGFPGLPGAQGLPGTPGLPGPPGVSKLIESQMSNLELSASKGEKGEPGEAGLIGLQGLNGQPGLPGMVGLKGELGPEGPPGSKGMKGSQGSDGIAGEPGLPGPVGPPGLPGPVRYSSEAQGEIQPIDDERFKDLCLAVVKEYISEIQGSLLGPPGPPGLPGRRGVGRPGRPGPQGPQGDSGLPGVPGERGYPGVPLIGPQGEMGLPGMEGRKGDRGEDGVGREGPMGPPGPEGAPGHCVDGHPGRPGEQGADGRPGDVGPRGPPGAPGSCPDCSAMQTAYAYPLLLAQQQQSNKGPSNYYNKGPPNYNNKGPNY